MNPLNVKQLGYALGAEVTGFDARKPISKELREQLRALWAEHLVLMFPGQPLTPEEQIAFTATFGDVDTNDMAPRYRDEKLHQIVYVTTRKNTGAQMNAARIGRKWHQDATYSIRPQKGALLRCVERPPVGGDTMFASMVLAYETLSPTMRAFLDPLQCVHDIALLPGAQAQSGNTLEQMAEIRRINPPVIHPLIRTIPETGKKVLALGWIREIIGLSIEESTAVLAFLEAHAQAHEFVYRHRWSVDDIVLWDNRAVRHIALPDYDHSKTRHMLRTSLLGEELGRLADGEAGLGNREDLIAALNAVT